jgi:hypothetical protein
MEWTDKLATGISTIDSQHKELFKRINNLVIAIKQHRCNADIEFGQRATTLCYLVNIVRAVGRVGEKLIWDPAVERFTNCDEGNQLLSRPRRKGYELPEV